VTLVSDAHTTADQTAWVHYYVLLTGEPDPTRCDDDNTYEPFPKSTHVEYRIWPRASLAQLD